MKRGEARECLKINNAHLINNIRVQVMNQRTLIRKISKIQYQTLIN